MVENGLDLVAPETRIPLLLTTYEVKKPPLKVQRSELVILLQRGLILQICAKDCTLCPYPEGKAGYLAVSNMWLGRSYKYLACLLVS
jgi:hypothetical protein